MPGHSGVIVTGGSSGIGLATAKEYARLGTDVAIIARTPAKLEKARDELETLRQFPEQLIISAPADLCDAASTKSAIDEVLEHDICPDVVVNSAGVINVGEFVEMSPEFFAGNIDSGFWSVVNPCRAIVPTMIERGSGHLVNVSSVAGFLGIYGYTSYSAAKYAVMGFTEALRCELKPRGVATSIVCPPDTDTPALDREKSMRPPETDAIAGTIKAIPPERVARSIVQGVERGKYLIIPDAQSRLYFRLKGLVPELFYRIVDGDVRKVRSGRG
jgi:3-dehydrosphinganine reductase